MHGTWISIYQAVNFENIPLTFQNTCIFFYDAILLDPGIRRIAMMVYQYFELSLSFYYTIDELYESSGFVNPRIVMFMEAKP